MQTLALVLCGLVAAEHFYFLVLECFLWTKPRTLKAFGQTLEQAQATATLAANQGVYNGFLGAGLLWGIWQQLHGNGVPTLTFFLVCVLIAAVVGGLTAKRSILFVQGGPAALALVTLLLGCCG